MTTEPERDRPRPRVTAAEIADAANLYENGESLQKISAIMGRPVATWHRILRTRVKMRNVSRTLEGSTRDQKIYDDYTKRDVRMADLASKYHISRQRVHQIVKRMKACHGLVSDSKG